MSDDEQALETLYRLLRASRWFGVAPFSSLRPPRVSCAFELYGKLFFICYCGMIVIAAAINYWHQLFDLETLSEQVSLSLRVCSEASCVAGIVYIGMFTAASRMCNTFEYLKNLKQICRNINSVLSDDPGQRQVFMFFLGIQLSIIVFNIADIWVTWSKSQPELLPFLYTMIFLASEFFFANIVMIQFVMVALTINLSFRTINDRLEDMLHTSNSLGSSRQRQFPHQKVHSLAKAYVTACGMVRQHNDSNKVLLVLLLLNVLANLVDSACYALKNSFIASVVTVEIMYYVLHVCRFMLLVTPSSAFNLEIGRTHKQIRKLMHTVRSHCDPLLPELETFQLHLTLNKPSYTVMGLYTLNRPLVLVVLAVCTTYVMIFQEF